MIKMQYLFEKNVLSKKQKEALFLVELQGSKSKQNNSQKIGLNIAIAIDISSSMNEPVKRLDLYSIFANQPKQHQQPPLWPHQPQGPWLGILPPVFERHIFEDKLSQPSVINKLTQAKKAAIEAVSKMKNGDFISIVSFDDKAKVVFPSTQITSENRIQVISAINALQVGGSTDLHAGWVLAATEVAKSLSKKYINRVVILTDGQTNHGIQNVDTICTNVSNIYKNSISTTTFGIGEGFNENLLEKMANSGAGNFYYVDDDKKLNQMFTDEFSGLSNIAGNQIQLKLELKNSSIVKQFNDMELTDNIYVIPNITAHSKFSALFKLSLKIKSNQKNLNLGIIHCSYIDENGNSCEEKIEVNVPVVDEKEYDSADWNQEVKVQETLLTIALNKVQATQALNIGDINSAKTLLSQSVALSGSCGFNDSRLLAETQTLNSTLACADTSSLEGLKKDISYQSYKTRYSK